MAWQRNLMIAGLAVVAAAVLVFLSLGGTDGETGAFSVRIDGPDAPVWNGTVEAHNATAFTVLLAAAEAGGFDVDSTGQGDQVFVIAIDGHRNEGSGGWCYAVWHDGAWLHPNMSSGGYGLRDSDAVWWHYERGGCPVG